MEIPDAPGAYMFRDAHGRVIYVGKAKSLRKRVASYFGRELHTRTSAMVESARDVDWIVASSEVEAIMLEYSLIKQHRPRFNIRLRDDKSYPYLAITRSDRWPRAHVMRGRRRRGTAYFGPYAHTYAIRKDSRPGAAHLSGAYLLRFAVSPPAARGPALPALPHREVLGALRGRGDGTRTTGRRWMGFRRSCRVTSTRWSRRSPTG